MIFLLFLSLVGRTSGKIWILHNYVICSHNQVAIQHNNYGRVEKILITTFRQLSKSDFDHLTNKHHQNQYSISDIEFHVDSSMMNKTEYPPVTATCNIPIII